MNAPSVPITIRRMRPEDIPAVFELDVRSFPTPWTLNSYLFEMHQNEASWQWVVVTPGADGEISIIGIIVIWLLVDEAHIATIAVDEAYRGQGIGTQLLNTALSELAERGAQFATLEVRVSNTPAQALYRHFGFEVAGQRKDYYQDNSEDAYIMRMENLAALKP